MPYIAALFDETTSLSMRETANRIAAGSAFEQASEAFHVPLIGSLHSYSAETIDAAVDAAPVLRGRFVKWEIIARDSSLRALIELVEPAATAVLGHLRQALPLGLPWRSHYVTLGSVAAVDAGQHVNFLTAVSEAFPIETSLEFLISEYAYHAPRPVRPHKAATKNASTKTKKLPLHRMCPSEAGKRVATIQKTSKRKPGQTPRRASPHRKWVR